MFFGGFIEMKRGSHGIYHIAPPILIKKKNSNWSANYKASSKCLIISLSDV